MTQIPLCVVNSLQLDSTGGSKVPSPGFQPAT
jgi:hypothetical protein